MSAWVIELVIHSYISDASTLLGLTRSRERADRFVHEYTQAHSDDAWRFDVVLGWRNKHDQSIHVFEMAVLE